MVHAMCRASALVFVAGAMLLCGGSRALAQSTVWDSTLSNTNWYVPTAQLLAYAAPRTGFSNPIPIGDQTLWSLASATNGSFTGTSVAQLKIGPALLTDTSTIQGFVNTAGQITMLFTPTSGGTVTVGLGHMRTVGGVTSMEMQMITGDSVLVTHWAYMLPYDPATFTPPASQPVPANSVPQWEVDGRNALADFQQLLVRYVGSRAFRHHRLQERIFLGGRHRADWEQRRQFHPAGLGDARGQRSLQHALTRMHPELDIRVRETMTPRLIQELVEGRLDTAIVALPVSEPSLTEVALFEEKFLLVRPSADEGTPAPSREMMREMRLLLLEEGHCFRDQALSFCNMQSAPPREMLDANSLSTLVQMVSAGIGVTLIPEMAVPVETRSASVSLARFRDPEPSRTIGMVWRKTSPLARQLLQISEVVCLSAGKVRAGHSVRSSRS